MADTPRLHQRVGDEQPGEIGWLKKHFPEKEWHRHASGTTRGWQWCDGTSSDCGSKVKLDD